MTDLYSIVSSYTNDNRMDAAEQVKKLTKYQILQLEIEFSQSNYSFMEANSIVRTLVKMTSKK